MLAVKSVSYDGVAAVTTDEVADALIAFALVVARYSSYECATIPVAVSGRREELTVMLGPTIHLSTLTTSAEDAVDIAGAAEVAMQLRARADAFTSPAIFAGADARG